MTRYSASGTTRSALVGSAVRAQLAPTPPPATAAALEMQDQSHGKVERALVHRGTGVPLPPFSGRRAGRFGGVSARWRSLAQHCPRRHVEAQCS